MKLFLIEEIPALAQYATKQLHKTVEPSLVEIVHLQEASEALEKCKIDFPAMVILDPTLISCSGIKIAEAIWRLKPSCKILFWSTFNEREHLKEIKAVATETSLFGYILKSQSDEKFRQAITCLFLNNRRYVEPIVPEPHSRPRNYNHALTNIEYETLADITLGLTDKALARRRGITARGVQSRLTALSKKLVGHEQESWQDKFGIELYNPRTKLILEGFRRGILTKHDIANFEQDLLAWLETQSMTK